MALDSPLVGPPGLCSNPSSISTAIDSDSYVAVSDGFGNIRLGFTENDTLTYVATGNPCLDFFFHVLPDTPSSTLIERLISAWAYDPLTTLKLVCNLRGIRGTGKSDREGFYAAALWLHKNHAKTLASNVKVFAEFGCYKDLLEVLYRLLAGENARKKVRAGNFLAKQCAGRGRRGGAGSGGWMSSLSRVRIAESKSKTEMYTQEKTRKEKQLDQAKKAFDRYSKDLAYRLLHDSVAEMFAEALKQDLKFLNAGEIYKITLASKWCPSIGSSYDKSILICESIARRIFPRESCPEYEGIEEAHYVYRVRDRLRKEVLVPLHRVLDLPEVNMSANRWESLHYDRVSSVAMKNYKEHFLRHDNDRFNLYLEDVRRGDAKIAADALLPHELINSLKDVDDGKVTELQWERIVEDMSNKGKFNNCIAVCDVSRSMDGTPREVCVALGLLISELSEEPWKGKVITFNENPKIHSITGDCLRTKAEFVKKMEWSYTTNFQKVYDRILEVATNGGLKEDEMIKKIFVFSHMEFGQACYSLRQKPNLLDVEDDYSDMDSDIEDEHMADLEEKWKQKSEKQNQSRFKGWETDYRELEKKFKQNGFNKVPEIVFWNLKNSSATPVLANQSGMALVSGFSKNLVKLFLENGGIIDPLAVMEQALSGELYQKLVLCD